MGKKFKNRKGFTLFELVVAIVIILILASIAIPNYLHLKYKASEARAYEDFSYRVFA
jgi:prepilin-type N-terminal cleavage/methylation domain-containing protein